MIYLPIGNLYSNSSIIDKGNKNFGNCQITRFDFSKIEQKFGLTFLSVWRQQLIFIIYSTPQNVLIVFVLRVYINNNRY